MSNTTNIVNFNATDIVNFTKLVNKNKPKLVEASLISIIDGLRAENAALKKQVIKLTKEKGLAEGAADELRRALRSTNEN